DRTGRGRVHPGVPGTGFSGGGGQTHVSSGAAYSASISNRSAAAATTSLRTPGTLAGNVSDTASSVGDGNVRVRVFVVFDGGSAVGDLAGLPAGHCVAGAVFDGFEASDVPRFDAWFHEHQCRSASRGRSRRVDHHADWYSIGIHAAWVRWVHFWFGE